MTGSSYEKKRAFARIIFTDPRKPLAQAALEAGYKGKPHSLSATASRLLRDAVVLQARAEMAREADAEAVVDYDRVVKDLDEMTIPTLADYWDAHGNWVGWDRLTRAQLVALKKVKVREKRSITLEAHDNEPDVNVQTSVIEIELHDRVKITELLGRTQHVGAFRDIVAHEGSGEHEKWLKSLRDKRGG